MQTILSTISGIISKAFSECGYDPSFGKVSVSNRPDLCEYQCNGAMAAAKQYHKAPFMIADEIVAKLQENDAFSKAESVKPGFINLDLSGSFICGFLSDMEKAENFGCEKEEEPQTIVIDYGGPNVAKPLHIGHLRSAIIGESIKRINRFFGNNVIGDVHLGDWGLQMGLIIEELKDRKPDLPYFDESFSGEYPKEPPFTLSDLEEIYPAASKKAKACKEGTKELTEEAAEFSKRAHLATLMLQQENRGYQALWHHILDLSIPDLKKNYDKLGVSFDIWKAESDAKPFIADMIKDIKDKGLAYESQGALVVDVAESSDQKEIPPLILTKSDGSALYPTTDLATLVDRERTYHPDKVIYVVDKRQEMHFTQVFRAARMAGIVRPETYLTFLGFGT
ncbi:MAG: arginine--tRNA ligase, partial [Lachnospiraceae bacterium]|nr:arginine--tRNA ligase [Lachnospiraceae bacterium]